jgi:tetratricopeptide (TPR) repeat protein
MKSFIIKSSYFFILALAALPSYSQNEYETKFNLGKELISKGRYAPAMEVLKPLTSDNPDNRYIRYAHYYYSLAALKGGMYQDAYNMLLQLLHRYPDWDKIDEAYYLIGNVSFEQKKYRQALKYLESVKKGMKEETAEMKKNYLGKVESLDTLTNIQKDFPQDHAIAKILAKRLSLSSVMNEKQRMLLEYLIQEYKLDRKEFSAGRKSIIKSSYNVAVVFPFLLKEMDPSAPSRNNQFVYDLYQGIKLAADSLRRSGIILNLFAYDTERNESKVAEILSLPEMKSMDLIIGPVYPQHYAMVNEFGLKNQIIVINPISENSNLLEGNPYVFLLQPTFHYAAGAASKYATLNFVREIRDDKNKNRKNQPQQKKEYTKDVLIFQSPTSKDSLAASYYRDSITALGFEVKNFEVIGRENMSKVQAILGDSVKLTKVSHIFVSSADQVLAANIVSAMDISGFKIPILTSSDWLSFALITYDQYERMEFHFLFPDFVDINKIQVRNFKALYYKIYNTVPFTNHAYEGYDLMILFGMLLAKHGNYFIPELSGKGFIPGVLLPGFNYSYSRSNSFVPIVKFINSELTVVNFPAK